MKKISRFFVIPLLFIFFFSVVSIFLALIASPSSAEVLSFTQTLSVSSQGSQVSLLQTFLARDSSLYPKGLVTGYYGALTQRAVQRFQAKYGIASSGTSQATGYGMAGPRTRAKLNELSGGTEIPSSVIPQPDKASPAPLPTPTPTAAPTPISPSSVPSRSTSGSIPATQVALPSSTAVSSGTSVSSVTSGSRRPIVNPSRFVASPNSKAMTSSGAAPLLSLDFNKDFTGGQGEIPIKSTGARITTSGEGIDGNAASLESGSYLTYPTSENFNADSGTFELWYKPTLSQSSHNQVVERLFGVLFECSVSGCLNYMVLDIYTGENKLLFKINDAQAPFDWSGAQEKTSASIFPANQINHYQWYHIAVSWDKASGSKLYINGSLVAQNSASFFLGRPTTGIEFANSDPTSVGKMTPQGHIDNMRVFDYPRSGTEIATSYSALKDPAYVFNTSDTSLNFSVSNGMVINRLEDTSDGHISAHDGGHSLLYDNKVLWLFADTLLTNGEARNNSFAETRDFDAANGIPLQYKKDSKGDAASLLLPHPGEEFLWPFGLVNQNGIVYTYYTRYRIDPQTWFWQIGEGWAKSMASITDINQVAFMETGTFWSADSHGIGTGPGVPVHDDGTWVYMSHDIVGGGTTLARVAKIDIENQSAYQYWNGLKWVSARNEAINIISAPYNETGADMSLGWNAYLGKWLMIHSAGPTLGYVVARTADQITGPWSQAKILVDCGQTQFIPCYAAKWHPEYDQKNGQRIYITTANWQRGPSLYLLEIDLMRSSDFITPAPPPTPDLTPPPAPAPPPTPTPDPISPPPASESSFLFLTFPSTVYNSSSCTPNRHTNFVVGAPAKSTVYLTTDFAGVRKFDRANVGSTDANGYLALGPYSDIQRSAGTWSGYVEINGIRSKTITLQVKDCVSASL